MVRIQKVNLFSADGTRSNPKKPGIQLLSQGYPTGRKVKGRMILDQYALEGRYLLITGNDIPGDDGLYITLLDQGLNKLDEISLYQPLKPGIYRPHYHLDKQILFSFFEDGLWCLQILEQPRNIPLNSARFPATRPLKLWGKQYLKLKPVGQVA